MAEPVRARRLTDVEGRRLQQIVRRGKHGSIRVRRAMIIMASSSGTPVAAGQPGRWLTTAELTAEAKGAISHRGKSATGARHCAGSLRRSLRCWANCRVRGPAGWRSGWRAAA